LIVSFVFTADICAQRNVTLRTNAVSIRIYMLMISDLGPNDQDGRYVKSCVGINHQEMEKKARLETQGSICCKL